LIKGNFEDNSMTYFPFSRRDMLKSLSCGFGYMAFAGLSSQASAGYENPLVPKATHFEPKAKRVIFLCMRGGWRPTTARRRLSRRAAS
jgi:hypothetical protein